MQGFSCLIRNTWEALVSQGIINTICSCFAFLPLAGHGVLKLGGTHYIPREEPLPLWDTQRLAQGQAHSRRAVNVEYTIPLGHVA